MNILSDHRTVRLITYAVSFAVCVVAVLTGFITIDDADGWVEKIPAVAGMLVSLLAAANITPRAPMTPGYRPDPTADYAARLRDSVE